jgi:Protein of unknown function (DUF2608)
MKNFFAALCLIPSLLFAEIFESDKMVDLVPHVNEDTWVFIDLDNTLIESCLHLGSAQWRGHVRTKAKNAGYDEEEVIEAILDQFWLFVQPFVPVRLVDPDSTLVIQKLKDSSIPVFALTAREPSESGYTQEQLSSVDASFCSSALPECSLLPSNEPSLFDDGVIYCGENTKSEALAAFFKEVGYMPKKVIFVDDKRDQVSALGETLEEMGIEYVGIRFSAADERVKSFDGEVADLQFACLPILVPDDQAKHYLQKFKKKYTE